MTVTISGTTGIAGVDGSAATPALQGADTNTGIFFPEADKIGIVTGGTERMRINNDGIALNGSTSGSVTFTVPAVAGDNTLTFPAATDTVATLAATQTLTNKTIQGGAITSATAQAQPASPAVASVDFTNIPSWVKRITVMFNNVSTNGTSPPLIQIGSGSVTSSGYLGIAVSMATTLGISGSNSTTGFQIASILAANVIHGIMTINLVDSATFNYTASFSGGCTSPVNALISSGSVTLTGLLDMVRITTVGGANTFDAGTINIMYE